MGLSNHTLDKNSRFFISLTQDGLHTFMLLGVMKSIHSPAEPKEVPRVLARVGKHVHRGISLGLLDEEITRKEDHKKKITYQAYEINYQQLREFLLIIKNIETAQLANESYKKKFLKKYDHRYQLRTPNTEIESDVIYLNNVNGRIAYSLKNLDDEVVLDVDTPLNAPRPFTLRTLASLQNDIRKIVIANGHIRDVLKTEAIECFVPIQEQDDRITFRFQSLQDYDGFSRQEEEDFHAAASPQLLNGAQTFTPRNTCRTTAKTICEATLKFNPKVSAYFFIPPKYQSTLIAGQPDPASFYILPPPPNVYSPSADLKQQKVLSKLYKRLENIPKRHASAPVKTRAKFDALASLYNDLVGKNSVSANDFLTAIIQHERRDKIALFSKRSPCFFSRCFALQSTTEKMFTTLKNHLRKPQ